MTTVQINSDMGEGFGLYRIGDDRALMPFIDAANVACGFHAADPMVMRDTVRLAKAFGVSVGAHPSLPDLQGFGRREMKIGADELAAAITYQVGALKAFLDAEEIPLSHVKPHGALYSMLNDEADLAEAVARAIVDTCPKPILYWPAPVELHALPKAAKAAGIKVVGEVYFDLGYTDDAHLVVERTKSEKNLAEVAERVRRFVRTGEVTSLSGKPITLEAGSICIHGDGPNAVALAETVLAVLREEGVAIEPAKAD